MSTQPMRTVTLECIDAPEPPIDLIPALCEALEMLRIFQEYEERGLRLHGMCAAREFLRGRQK